ncbi:general L-amino acid transport system permease protein [Methylopila capsulata]|uniref:Amino acid ABC transporter permease n=1 Tax=Methylopila capsulata TaxID=61654 RepID=A0A9W6IYU0_9HYPH|nr:amino acid ABC transporter permease [Methylopila capsulata]MBM7853165.1 general L-amino acid transport system permease protein [Methylopila capsulata]GLK57621.1 amino acid ABC transporter permease [Methylopila capsulata]
MAITHEGPAPAARPPSTSSIWNDARFRGNVAQVVVVVVVALALGAMVWNAQENLSNQRIASGFGFLDQTAGFGLNQTLIPYSESSSYGRALLVAILNTLLVAVVGIVFATILGFLVGVGRLSKNWMVRKVCTVYVEVTRNLPLLFHILFWYLAVLAAMPAARNSYSIFGEVFLNNRGVYIPRIVFGEGSLVGFVALGIAIVGAIALNRWSTARREKTGQQFPVFWTSVAMLVALPLIGFALVGFPLTIETPVLRGFNFVGGSRLLPEFAALVVALSIYTGGFIAEIVRAGIKAVSHGQSEAAASLGLKPSLSTRLVVIPQAMRVMIPPLTSQYLNLTKNSSLAAFIGYPELVQVFAGTTLNQTGQAIEIIAITMGCYLVISLVTSLFMNWYNRRVALIER